MYANLIDLLDAIRAKDINRAWSAFVRVGDMILGPHVHEMRSEDPAKVREVVSQLEAECKASQSAPTVGHHTRWHSLLQVIVKFLPIILDLLKEQPTA